MQLILLFKNLGLVVAVVLTAFLAFIFVREPYRSAGKQNAASARSIEIGADLYELHCRTCHGSRGEGVGQLGPALSDEFFFKDRLREVGWQDSLKSYIMASSSHGRIIATRPKYAGNSETAVMNPWLDSYGGPLRRDQLENITDFVMNWEATALGDVELKSLEIVQTNLDSPETIEIGKKVFLESCRDCHSISRINEATKKGPDLTHIAQVATTRNAALKAEAYIKESFLIPSEYIVEGFERERLGYQCGGVLTKQQLDEVTAFLLTLK